MNSYTWGTRSVEQVFEILLSGPYRCPSVDRIPWILQGLNPRLIFYVHGINCAYCRATLFRNFLPRSYLGTA